MNNNLILRYILKYSLIVLALIFFLLPIIKEIKNFKNIGIGKILFCLFNSTMLCLYCPFYTIFIVAPFEVNNDLWVISKLFTVKSGLICLGLGFLIGIIFFRTLYIKLPMLMKQEYIKSVWKFLFLIPLMLTVLIYWSIPLHPDLAMVGRLRPAALIILVLILFVIWLLYHLFWWTAKKIIEGTELQQENNLLTIEGKRYEEIRNYMNETRELRHDFRQHILVINHLLNSGKIQELQNYLKQFNSDSNNNSKYTGYCANIAVDALISHYASEAEKGKIKFECKLNIPESKKMPIKETEYCVIIGNLIENAFNALKKVREEKRNIKIISAMMSETIIGISVKNPFIDSKGKQKDISKNYGNGIGLSSINNIIKRYNGTMKIKTENNIFSVDIILYCGE